MLGKLARWLRILGHDVIYGPHLSGHGLIRAARAEERLILTRDRRLKQKQPPPFIMIASDRYREQLRQVIDTCRLEIGAVFSLAVSNAMPCWSPKRGKPWRRWYRLMSTLARSSFPGVRCAARFIGQLRITSECSKS